MSFIYLANPYSDPDPKVIDERFRQAERALYALLMEGRATYSPIVHCHELAKKYDLPKTFDFWRKYDLSMIASCSDLYVLMLDGWEASPGVRAEVEFARSIGVPVSGLRLSKSGEPLYYSLPKAY